MTTKDRLTDVRVAQKLRNLRSASSGLQPTLVSGVNIKTINGNSLLESGDLVISGGGVSDGDKGDITVASSGDLWTIDAGAVSTSKMGGDVTAAGKALLDDADAAAQRTTLGLGTAATASASSFAPASHTHTAADIADFNSASEARIALARSTSWVSATANLPSGYGVLEYEQTIVAASCTPTSKIALMLDPATAADENQAEGISLLNMSAYPDTGQFTLNMQFREYHSGPIKLFYQVN